MTNTPIVKIAKSGESISSNDIRDFVFDSRYSMFKYHSNSTTSVVISAGDTEKSSTVSHSLGYIPAFIAYYKRSDESVERLVPDIPYGVDFDFYPWAYATTTGVTVGYSYADPYNKTQIAVTDYWRTYANDNNYFSVGRISNNPFEGAFRFSSVAITGADSLVSAKIQSNVTGKDGSGDIKFKTYGIDEDNTSSFGSSPMGRTKTTAYSSNTRSVPTNIGDDVEIDVKDAVLEIADRGSWSSGNAMGFIINEDSGDSDAWFSSTSGTTLDLVISGTLTISFRVIIFKDKLST